MAGKITTPTGGPVERFAAIQSNYLAQPAPDLLPVIPVLHDPTQGRRVLFVEGTAREFTPSSQLQDLIAAEQRAWDKVRTLQHSAEHKEQDAIDAERVAKRDDSDAERLERDRDRLKIYRYSHDILKAAEFRRADNNAWIARDRARESLEKAAKARAEAKAAWDRVADARTVADEATRVRVAKEAEERAIFAEQQATRDQDNIV